MTLGQGHHWVFLKKKKELKTTWEFLCPSVSIHRVSTWCDALCWQSRLIHTCAHTYKYYTHTHTRQEPSSQSALSKSLRSEGAQSKDREASPVCAGGWIRADTWQSHERQSTARPGDLPPTSPHDPPSPSPAPIILTPFPTPQLVRNPLPGPRTSSPTVIDISVIVPSHSFGFPPMPQSKEGLPWPPHLSIKAPHPRISVPCIIFALSTCCCLSEHMVYLSTLLPSSSFAKAPWGGQDMLSV